MKTLRPHGFLCLLLCSVPVGTSGLLMNPSSVGDIGEKRFTRLLPNNLQKIMVRKNFAMDDMDVLRMRLEFRDCSPLTLGLPHEHYQGAFYPGGYPITKIRLWERSHDQRPIAIQFWTRLSQSPIFGRPKPSHICKEYMHPKGLNCEEIMGQGLQIEGVLFNGELTKLSFGFQEIDTDAITDKLNDRKVVRVNGGARIDPNPPILLPDRQGERRTERHQPPAVVSRVERHNDLGSKPAVQSNPKEPEPKSRNDFSVKPEEKSESTATNINAVEEQEAEAWLRERLELISRNPEFKLLAKRPRSPSRMVMVKSDLADIEMRIIPRKGTKP